VKKACRCVFCEYVRGFLNKKKRDLRATNPQISFEVVRIQTEDESPYNL